MGLRERVATAGTRDNQRYEWVMARARKFFWPNFRALEVGPGDGTFAAGLNLAGYAVHAIDVRPAPDRMGLPWTHHQVDICQGALAGTFDLIHCGQVLEHIADPDAAMINIIRMTHPGSLVLISVPNFRDPEHVRTYQAEPFFTDMARWLNIHETQTWRGNGRECYAVAGRPL